MSEKLNLTQRNIRLPLSALQLVDVTQTYFKQPDLSTDEKDVELTFREKTADGFVEIGWDHLETQKSLHHYLIQDCTGPLDTWPQVMQLRVSDALQKINSGRKTPLDANSISREYLFRMAEPKWTEQTGDDTLSHWPEHYHSDLKVLKELDDKLKILSRDEKLRHDAHELWDERTEVMKQAIEIIKRRKKMDKLAREIADIRANANISGQRLSIGKRREIEEKEKQIQELKDTEYDNSVGDKLIDDLEYEIERRTRSEVRRQFEQGLVLTEPMQRIMFEALPSIIKGSPVLFIGETGGAKTALAKYLSRECMDKEPEIVSGYADVNGYQLMGKTGLTTKDGATISEFISGPVIRAMEEGRPLILDEINAMPPEFLKRLNEITQLRPGDKMSVQEDSGKIITVTQGFCVIATANEKSRRYQGVHDLSTEFRNRFTANTYRIGYPDGEVVTGQDPLDNYRIAYAATCDRQGTLLFEEGSEKLEEFAKAAHLTQRLFSGHINEGLSQDELDVVGTARIADGNTTGLDENVLAPRTMVALLEKVVNSHGALSLSDVLLRWLESIKSQHDKKVIGTILRSRRLI